ncbi:hypothetical protein ACJMK2_032633 [Sinanodonta woodiana]|uniref:Uncharacterized protein n=1 Tax=Sinanodonta woodiana TaxID=1069815 RepID=A0ABD3X2C1_SINWO
MYNTLYIHKDGILGFTRDIQYDQVDWSDKMQTSTYGSSPFIAPFFYNALALQKSAQGYAGQIYYREFNQGIAHTPSLHNLSSYIQATVVGSDNFNAVWGLEVTWVNVTSQKEFEDLKCMLSSYSSCKKNTFQVMLLVNETDTYAIINYANLDIEIGKYFQAGFNGGNYRGWTPILPNTHSGHKADISLLANNQASDIMGRYIFRISGNNIVRGGCYRHDWYNTLEIYPSYGGMFGGEMIDVAGPCFNQANLICKLGDHRSSKTSIGVYVSTTRMRCPVPMLTERGRIQLSISMNGGATFQYFAHYTVVFPGRLSSSLRVELPSVGNDTWYNQVADTLQIRWDPGLLTNDTSATLDITLFGFMERNNESFYQMLETLGSAPVFQGTYQFHAKDHHCSGDACSQFEVGLVEIKLQSRFTPLSHNPQGSGNQCCYGPDGVLRFAADTFQGSTPDRSHDWGAAPYVLPGRVPAMSHWIKDVVTFYYCCLWVDYSKCDHYMDQRPTRDCSGYIPPKAAMVYGYGHIQTFSGTKKYRILTNGDLVLMTALHTVIQGRFEYNPFLRTELWDNSSYSLTSVSVRDYMNSDTAEIRLLGPTAKRNNRRLEVRINGQFIPFDNEALQWQDFRGLAVVDTDTTKMNSNFTILMTNGVGLQVAERNNILSLVVMVPDTFKDNLTGLLGDWYGNLHHYNNTPFTEQSDSIYDQHPNSSYNLQQEWVVILNDSLMYDYKIIGHNIYIPFTSPSIGRNTFCLQSDACNYDFFVSKSYDTANTTIQLESDFQVRTSFLEPVRSCGLLDVPRSIKSNYNYTLGTVTTITGCRTGPLSGNTIYSCESTGNMTQQWTPGVSATCEPQTAEADVGLIAGIVVGVVGGALIVVLIVVIIRYKRRRKQPAKKSEDRYDGDEMENEKPSRLSNEYEV